MSDTLKSARRISAAAATLALAVSCGAAPSRLSAQPAPTTRSDQARLHEMVTAERAFSKLSADRGMKQAFLTYLSDSGVIFRPTAINGKQSWNARQNPASTLLWEPAFGEISYAGDLGVSTGPWKLTFPPDRKQPTLFGRFLSMWRRQPDGSWKVEADIGISHEEPYRAMGATTFHAGRLHPAPGPVPERLNLAALDRAIGLGGGRGIGGSYRKTVTDDFQLLREGSFLYDRAADGLAAVDSLTGRFDFTTQGSGVAKSADLAYSYGIAERYAPGSTTPTDTTVYFHVWRRNPGGWRVAMAVLNPLR